MLLDQDSDEDRGMDSQEQVHALKSVLHKLDTIAKRTGADEPLLRMAALLGDFDELKEIEPSRRQQEKQNLDWEHLEDLPEFREVLDEMFKDGYLLTFLKETNLPKPVYSWLKELRLADRIRFYLEAEVTDDTVRLLEGFNDELPEPLVFSVLSLVIPNLNQTPIQIAPKSADREAEDQPIEIFLRIWVMFHWYPEQLQDFINKLEISQLITLLETVFAVRRNSSGETKFQSRYENYPAIAQTLEAILALATKDPYVVKMIEQTIIEESAKKGLKDQEKLFGFLFSESQVHPEDQIMPLGEEDTDYDEMVETLAGIFLSGDVKPALKEWVNRANSKPGAPFLNRQFSRDVLGLMLDETLGTDNPVISLLWLWIAGTRWQMDDPDVDEWLWKLIEFAGDDPLLVRRVLTLGNDNWGDSALLDMWIAYVTKEWIQALSEADEKSTDDVALFANNFVLSQEFRQFINVFSASSDILVPRNPAELTSFSRLTVPCLISAALGNTQSREHIQNSTDMWGHIFLVAIELENPDPESIWAKFEYDNRIIDVPYAIWNDLGLPEERVLISSLLSFVQRYVPDVMMGVSLWQAYVAGTKFDQHDQVAIKDVLDRLQKESIDESLKFSIEVCLAAEAIRIEEGLLPGDPEDIQQLAEQSLELLRSLRGKFRDPDVAPDTELYLATSAAIVGGSILGWWKVLKPLLLTFRSLPALSVGNNLLHLDRSEVPLSVIPDAIDHILRLISKPDDLRDVRRSMTLYLLDKLKPIKGNPESRMLNTPLHDFEGFDPSRMEPDPVWRTAYLRALDDLAVKQTGKGHSIDPVLRKVSEEDLSPMVQEVAVEVRRGLQNLRTGWGPGSHRRHLFQAWWWIRQAHRISFNAEIDEVEANRVRNTEFR
ncbi:hypothetical protein B4O97_16310 [Marispirochaeta aestuarii]|uniref:Uncharacterized protein n=2 Tax=Marispirochaeta aestuarii TaxID=1963862 RepID=A0A1Y1RUC3_9SPIO|nr:hypothetical protein B4O97_16310 [Marispirochaeta aestuarii]